METEKQRLTKAVQTFAKKMEAKLHHKADQCFIGWDDPACRGVIAEKLRSHTERLLDGDQAQAVDVANLAMMLECL